MMNPFRQALRMNMIRRLMVCSFLCSTAQQVAIAEPVSETVTAVNAFAATHHRFLPKGNALISPWSIQTSMAMAYAGANGATRDAMRKALFFPQEDNLLNDGFKRLQQSLLISAAPELTLEVRLANRVYVDQSLSLSPSWLAVTRSFYGSEAAPVDFRNDLAGAGKVINHWVSDQTKGKIPLIIPDGGLHPMTLLVLVNAVYFNLPWDERFTKELTQDQPFQVDARHSQIVPLMFKQHRIRFAQKAGFQIAALPYAGGTFQFVVIVPDAVDGLAQVEASLTGDMLSECSRLGTAEVRLSIPRIRMEPDVIDLRSSLTALGAGVMFDPHADFSKMVAKEGTEIYVSAVYHRTFMELDEDGTKAAAATAKIFRTKNGVPHDIPHKVVKADHPFLFMIQHVESGACLFLGRLADPGGAPVSNVRKGTPKK